MFQFYHNRRIYLYSQLQSIQGFCQKMIAENGKVIATITNAYDSIATIIIHMEGLVIGSSSGQHEKMEKTYGYWDRTILDFLITLV